MRSLTQIVVRPILQESAMNRDFHFVERISHQINYFPCLIASVIFVPKSKGEKGFDSLEVHLPANIISKHDGTGLKYLFTLEFPVGFCLFFTNCSCIVCLIKEVLYGICRRGLSSSLP